MTRKTHIKLFIGFILLLFAVQIIGCKKSDKIEIKQSFSEGGIYRFKVEKNNVTFEDSSIFRAEYYFDVELTAKDTDDGIECSWKYGEAFIPNVDMEIAPQEIQKIININKGLTVKFLVGENGKFQRITNLDECRRHIYKKNVNLYWSAEERKEKVLERAYFLYSLNDEELIDILFPEIIVHFELFGNIYDPNTVASQSVFIKNPFDNNDFEMTTTSKVDDFSGNTAYISERTELSEKDYNYLVEKFQGAGKYVGLFRAGKVYYLTYDVEYKVLKESFCKLTVFEDGIEKHISVAIVSNNDWAKAN